VKSFENPHEAQFFTTNLQCKLWISEWIDDQGRICNEPQKLNTKKGVKRVKPQAQKNHEKSNKQSQIQAE